jgi:hypothetical protein
VVEERYPVTEVEVFETQGSSENIRLLEAGHADFATVQADADSDDGIRAVASLYFDAYQLVVPEASDIQSPADLVGRRVAIGSASSGQYQSFWFLADHYGVQPDQLRRCSQLCRCPPPAARSRGFWPYKFSPIGSRHYRGVPVLSAYGLFRLDGFEWAVIAEIDREEVLAEVAQVRLLIPVCSSLEADLPLASIDASAFQDGLPSRG